MFQEQFFEDYTIGFTRRTLGLDVPREQVFAVIDAAFGQRRKMLRSALAEWAGSPAEAVAALERAGVPPTARAEELDVTAFAAIAAAHRGVGPRR